MSTHHTLLRAAGLLAVAGWASVGGFVGCLVGGCAPAQVRATTLTADDLAQATEEMAEKLRSSDFLKGRSAESPPITVAIRRVQNRTTDLIPEGEQWWLMTRVRDRLDANALRRERNITFVIPAEQLKKALAAGTLDAGAAAQREPTHVMTATFLSATRLAQGAAARTEVYQIKYQILDLREEGVLWEDTFDFKRQGWGKLYD